MSINLRDQVRANDPVPLQFKYEAADCRIFYTLRNVWNSTQLWHDTVAAAFDDHSLCTKGSTGFSKSPAAAPEPPESQAFPMDWDRNTPELIVHDEDLDLSGGPQDSRRAPQLQPLCDKSGLCKYGTCVVDETKPDCSHIQRCYPRVTKASCPANFIFEARNDVTVSAVKNNFVPEADDIVKVLDITRRAWMVPGKPKSIGTAKPVESHPGQHIKRILRGTCTPKVVPHRGCPQR